MPTTKDFILTIMDTQDANEFFDQITNRSEQLKQDWDEVKKLLTKINHGSD